MLVASHVCYCDLLLTCGSLQMQEMLRSYEVLPATYIRRLLMAITIAVLSGFSMV